LLSVPKATLNEIHRRLVEQL